MGDNPGDTLHHEAETGCCPRFNPASWDETTVTWDNKLFLKDQVKSILYVPLGFSKVMTKNMEMIQQADALSGTPLMLSDEQSPWKTTLYIAVKKEVPLAEMATISGTFLSKVFEGPFKNIGKWKREMKEYVLATGKVSKNEAVFFSSII